MNFEGGSKLVNGGLILIALILIALAIRLLHTSSFATTSGAFTRKSTSGSTDPLSEGLYLAQPTIRSGSDMKTSIRPVIAVQKPLVDLSISPMKREIPPMASMRRWTHRAR